MLCALAVDAEHIGCWRCVHWTLTLCALLINTECFACWCSVHWLLILCALMLILFAIAVDTACIGFWLIHVLSPWAGAVLIVPFVAVYFNELFLLPLSPHPHVILHAGFTRSCRIHCFKKRRKTFSRRGNDYKIKSLYLGRISTNRLWRLHK